MDYTKAKIEDVVVRINELYKKSKEEGLTEQEKEITPKNATFEVSGVITKIQPEMIKDQATGNGIVMLDVIGYEGTIIPVKLTIPSELVDGFGQAGFYEGGTGKFTGNIINTKTVETVVEKQAFGEDKVFETTKTVKRYEVRGGSPLGGFEALKITQEEYSAAQSKRRLKLDEIKNGTNGVNTNTQANTSNPFGQVSQQTQSNPFSNSSNPFAR